MNNVSVLLGAFSVTTVSCIKEIDYPLKDQPPQLVISSILTSDSLIKVYVGSTRKLLDTNQLNVENAVVRLYQNNVFYANFIHKGKGLYMLPFNFSPFEGRTYKVLVNAPGYKEASAETEIPVLNNNYSLKVTYPYKYDQNNEPTTYFELTINDPPNTADFYEFNLYWKDNFSFDYFSYYQVRTKDNILNDEGDISYNPPSFLISDRLFNGKTITISFELIEFYGFTATYPKVYYSLKSASEPYYKYKKYLLRHLYNQNSTSSLDDPLHLLFSGEPSNMYTNVNGGYGAVVGYSGELKEIIL